MPATISSNSSNSFAMRVLYFLAHIAHCTITSLRSPRASSIVFLGVVATFGIMDLSNGGLRVLDVVDPSCCG